jgi:hypothetical protein
LAVCTWSSAGLFLEVFDQQPESQWDETQAVFLPYLQFRIKAFGDQRIESEGEGVHEIFCTKIEQVIMPRVTLLVSLQLQ